MMDSVLITLSVLERTEVSDILETTACSTRRALVDLVPIADAFLRPEKEGFNVSVSVPKVSARILQSILPGLMQNITVSRGRVLLALEAQLNAKLTEEVTP